MIAFLLSDVLFIIIIIIHPIVQSDIDIHTATFMMWMQFHISTFRRLFNADDVGAKNNAMLDDYYWLRGYDCSRQTC
jgi:hypothetical protein